MTSAKGQKQSVPASSSGTWKRTTSTAASVSPAATHQEPSRRQASPAWFKEKPNLETAEQYLAAGNYYWNAGIFVWNIDTISKAIRTFQPQLASIMDEMAPSFYTEQEKEVVGKLFPTCEKISIDYAVMEKSKEIYTLPAEFGWSDLGSWGSLRTLLPQDEAGNAMVGKDIRLYECKNCVVHAADESKVVVQGLDGYIVAEKNGQLLVCSLKEKQRIKEFKQIYNDKTKGSNVKDKPTIALV